MKGYIVSVAITDERKEGSMFVFWGQGSWKILRFPKSQAHRKKLKELIRSKPKELFMRATIDGETIDFPLVTTQWEKAAENAAIDNPHYQFNFRIVNRQDDVSGLNLAIIEQSMVNTLRAGDKVTFIDNWGRRDGVGMKAPLIKKGEKGTIIQVSDDGNSFCIETAIGKFSWIREKFVRPNKIHRFMRSIADIF